MLHAERLDGRAKRLHPLPLPVPLNELPDGAMVQAGDDSFLIADGRPLLWTFDGYREAIVLPTDARLVTPPVHGAGLASRLSRGAAWERDGFGAVAGQQHVECFMIDIMTPSLCCHPRLP